MKTKKQLYPNDDYFTCPSCEGNGTVKGLVCYRCSGNTIVFRQGVAAWLAGKLGGDVNEPNVGIVVEGGVG